MSSLVTIWNANRDFFEAKSIQQLLAMCGDGVLRDDGGTSMEFRHFLEHVPGETLARFAEDCLVHGFEGSGLVLQDVVNQIGTRLGFVVENGRYRGISGAIGFDGIWRGQDSHEIIVEVKTTDAYRINLEVISGYRRRLIEGGRLTEALSSVLLVVGRQDTGDLEAQIRGSKHAWDARLISVDALCRLMKVKAILDEPSTNLKINQILKPREYTRLDPIIDLIFDTSRDVGERAEDSPEAQTDQENRQVICDPLDTGALRQSAIDLVSRQLGNTLIKQGRSVFSTPDQTVSVVCMASKRYVRGGGKWYWFTIRQRHLDHLKQAKTAFFCFACGAVNQLVLVPASKIMTLLPELRNTDANNWQVEIDCGDRNVHLDQPRTDITPYVVRPGVSA